MLLQLKQHDEHVPGGLACKWKHTRPKAGAGLGTLEQGPHLLKYTPQLVIHLVVQRRLGPHCHAKQQPHHLPCMATPAATYAAVTGLPTTNCS